MPAAGILISAAYKERAGHEPFHRATVLPATQSWGHGDCLRGQAGLGVGRPCLHGGGQAVIAILATDVADGTVSVGDGQGSAYRGIPEGSLRCAYEEPSRGDKIQPGLTRTESRWTEAGKQMERRKFGHNLKAPKCLVRKTHITGSCLSGRPACSQP